MRISRYACNNCGAEGTQDQLVHVEAAVGSQRDPASGRSEDITTSVDLCPPCASRAMTFYMKPQDYTNNRRWVTAWTKKHPVVM